MTDAGKHGNDEIGVSVVVPALNEVENLPKLCEMVAEQLRPISENYEIIIVDDGSSDGSLKLLKELHERDARIQYLSFSRNFGHQPALIAGLEHCKGQAVISMDADLQHPPELIPEMVRLWREGNQVIFTTKKAGSNLSIFSLRRHLMSIGYMLLRRVSGMNLSFGQSDFRLLDRQVVECLRSFPERDKLLRGLVDWVGFKQTGISYDVPPRVAGEPKYNLFSLLRLVLSGIFSYTIFPLRLFTGVGIFLACICLCYALFAVISGLYGMVSANEDLIPPGWASLAAAITFLGSIQLIGIGLLGEYIGRIYDETKHRPIYLIAESSHSFSEEN